MWFQSSCFGSKGVKEKDLRRCGCGELFISCSGLLKCRDPPLNLYNRCWISGRQKLWASPITGHLWIYQNWAFIHLKKSSLYQCHKLGVSKVTARVLLLAGEFISGISPCGAVVVVRGWSYCWQGCSWLQHLDQNAFMASILSYFLLFLLLVIFLIFFKLIPANWDGFAGGSNWEVSQERWGKSLV